MSLSLIEALGQVDLEAGRVYCCQVKGQWVEVRVGRPDEVRPSTQFEDADVMLDPWVEFPPLPASHHVIARIAPLHLPDVPEIPLDWDES